MQTNDVTHGFLKKKLNYWLINLIQAMERETLLSC